MEIRMRNTGRRRIIITILLMTLGWILFYPIIKGGVQTRLEHELNEERFIVRYCIYYFLCLLYPLFIYSTYSIKFRDEENIISIKKRNVLGFKRKIEIRYYKLKYSIYNTFRDKQINIYDGKKLKAKIKRNDFEESAYNKVQEKLAKIISEIKQLPTAEQNNFHDETE